VRSLTLLNLLLDDLQYNDKKQLKSAKGKVVRQMRWQILAWR